MEFHFWELLLLSCNAISWVVHRVVLKTETGLTSLLREEIDFLSIDGVTCRFRCQCTCPFFSCDPRQLTVWSNFSSPRMVAVHKEK